MAITSFPGWSPSTRSRNSTRTPSRSDRQQTLEEVTQLRKKYEEPIFGENSVYRLLELLAQVIDPTMEILYCASQLTHTLQVLEKLEEAGITDREFLATMLIHDLCKLA